MSGPTIAELRELLAKATPGPWRVPSYRGKLDTRYVITDHASIPMAQTTDAALIIATVNALPALLDRIAQLEAIEKAAAAVVDDGGLTSSEEEDDFCTTCHRSSYHHEPNCTAVALRVALDAAKEKP